MSMTCFYCSRHLHRQRRSHPIAQYKRTKDHIVPAAWGGPAIEENFRYACYECNLFRGACGHCVGAMACVDAVVESMREGRYAILRSWNFRRFKLKHQGLYFRVFRGMRP